MNNLGKWGRKLFAIPLVVFGVQYLTYGRFVGGLPPVPPWSPGAPFLAYLARALLVATGVSIAINFQARLSSTLLGIFFFACVVVLHGLKAAAIVHDGVERTRAFEPLALAGAAWILAGSLPVGMRFSDGWESLTDKLAKVGLYLFGISMVIFGVQHFLYAPFIATLIPTWIPAHLFWAYFTGVAFIAAAIAMVTGMQARLGATLLGVMFLLWVIVLHAPRVLAQPHNGDELTSAFVALAMCGSSFVLAATARKSG